MVNDSGNKPVLFGLDTLGNIKKQLEINAKNKDWEDLASDKIGNIYIGDFGNNANDRKKLIIYKVFKDSLSNKKTDVEKISFYYPDQKQFPPKTKNKHFDCESFVFYNDSLFLFTKSRTKEDLGKTNLYKIPAKKGRHVAEFVSSFTTCNDYGCWVTSADINDSGSKIAILTEHFVWIFADFKSSNFFSVNMTQLSFDHYSQKESVMFKNDSTLYITDERSGSKGGNLYEFKIH